MRRKRFKVRVRKTPTANATSIIIMAYSADRARSYANSCGWVVERVSSVKRHRAVGAKSAALWRVDAPALRTACAVLDINWPVRVTRTTSLDKRGQHAFKYRSLWPTARHYITVDKRLSPEEATYVLWHELAHAAQAERCAEQYALEAGLVSRDLVSGREAVDAWRKAESRSRHYKYVERPCEVEANNVAHAHKDYALTKAA